MNAVAVHLEAQNLSQFVCQAREITPEPGELTGTCCICTTETSNGHPVKLPTTFMSWTHFQDTADPVLCQYCQHMLKERKYRSSSWLVQNGSFTFVKAVGVRAVLDDIPEPPWALYATQSYKKHGWLNTEVNTSRETFYLSIDATKYLVRRDELTDMIAKIRQIAEIVGRWAWIQGDVRLEAESELALHDYELYSWWKANGRNALVLFLVAVMVPTKKELQELGLFEEEPIREEEKEEEPTIEKTSTLDELLGL